MTRVEFTTQIDRLKSQWGNSYGPDRVAALWVALERTDGDIFRQAVTQALLEHKTPPLLTELRDEIKAVYESDRHARSSSQSLLNRPGSCSICVDGYYFHHTEVGGVETFRCSCPAGSAMPSQYTFPNGQTVILPQWKGHAAR